MKAAGQDVELSRRELVLGGARSGKSRLAERLVEATGWPVTYIATATQGKDEEMAERIRHHQARRPGHWTLVEEPLALAQALNTHAEPECCVLVDCLTLWLTNLLLCDDAGRLAYEKAALLETLPQLPGRIVLVSNEVGQGIVPMGALSRRFVDEAGWLHQALAERCERVSFVIAGLPQVLKGPAL
ncbi:adenosylcobinamide kinase/adenosylcobinamide-phosphate guanylyltransferase [Oceanimonas sp. GK1]|uniref:bifunctional adenosylcobinamide kinase/adenosylcobinamide-phosphate guanylyltransferase n=1 Tax=Oceanimonas sp. (strain GK1 / IBRC-M 10197) TaxID=511062 RepID=UPI0002495142|nr:bifunctional adenosylcobinamide kinase/adenosylcobinamide-phosphate guanylyltransferase [Oceanimonas sp. GK1]AEY00864.1 adenosylcobinamide kinase/adenosylcobinamide-phosphate guanylyltransferase [Oceanimonas sp. GK1]